MNAYERRAAKLRKARNVGRLLFFVFGILAVVGNVQAAGDSLSSKLWHALPPIAFLLSVEVAILFLPEFSEKVARAGYAATGFIAAASFALSYMSLYAVAHDAGMKWGSWLFPILFEVAALTFSGIGIAASRALAGADHDARMAELDAEAARVEAERARVEAEQRAAEQAARAERDALEAVQREATRAPSQAEQDGLKLREVYGDALPTYKAMSEALGWSVGKVSEAVKAYRAQGVAPVEPAAEALA